MKRNERVSIQVEKPHLTICGVSDPGMKRAENEDTIFVDGDGHFMLLADGMGGHERGAEASETAVEIMQEFLHPDILLEEIADITDAEGISTEIICLSSLVEDAVQKANADIFHRNQEEGVKRFMGTTVVGLVPLKTDVLWFHVGDSRLYQWKDFTLKQLTTDHSAHLQWERGGRQGEKPAKNVITRAIGPNKYANVDIGYGDRLEGDIYILCSDGLSDMLSDDEIAGILAEEKQVPSIAARLVDAANDAGGKDNVSVVVCQIGS